MNNNMELNNDTMLRIKAMILEHDAIRTLNVFEILIDSGIMDESIKKRTIGDFNMLYNEISALPFDLPEVTKKMNEMKEKYNL